jgi:membrane-associated phospholipid phosphatase
MKPLHLVLFILSGIILITLSYFFVDRQVVWFLVRHHSTQFGLLKIFANDIVLALTVAIFIFYIYYALCLTRNKIGHVDKKLLLACNAVVIGSFLKDILKNLFGRYWASTFTCNNPSLLNNHVYGFNWLKSGGAYQSFPSGHTTFIVAFATSMWFLFPKLRWLWALLACLVMVGQIGMYYHFVSDVLGGIMLGMPVGFYSTYKLNA